jgi:hypothetical protein
MDKSTTLTICSVAGAIYAAQTILAPQTWLEPNKLPVNDDTIFITRACGGGILGMTVMGYLSKGASGESQDIALKAQSAACAVWTAVNVASYNGTTQKKMDIGTCAILGGLCAKALLN